MSRGGGDGGGALAGTHVRERSSVGLEREEKNETLTPATHPLNKHLAVNTAQLAFLRVQLNICAEMLHI